METFSALLILCAGNSPVTGEFPAQRPVTRSFDVFFDLAWVKNWADNRDAGDLRRHRAHYDVIVIILSKEEKCEDTTLKLLGYLSTDANSCYQKSRTLSKITYGRKPRR